MSTDSEIRVFLGTVIDASQGLALNAQKCVLGIQDDKIVFRESADKVDAIIDKHGLNKADIRVLSPGQFLMPGFVDTHLHAPQYRFAGSKMNYQLLPWLQHHTFPTETKFSDLELAKDVFNRVVRDTINNGTTTAAYYSTLHLEASLLLSDIAEIHGQRAFIGKVNMDVNCPDNYRENTGDSIKNTEIFIRRLCEKNNPLITPIITPRTALVCSQQLLQSLGFMAKQYDLPIQSHLSENTKECADVLEMFPDCKHYTEIYDKFHLLTSKTIMAHGIYLNESELKMLYERGSGIAHCPNSNISLRSGLCDVRTLLNSNVKVGLGTDVAGGYSSSILDSIRQSLLTSKLLSMKTETNDFLNYQDAFRLATLGGCQMLGLDNELGTLEVGKKFDASLANVENSFMYFLDDSLYETIEKFFHYGDDRNIQEVYVAGKRIK